jgi:hypothetical protein
VTFPDVTAGEWYGKVKQVGDITVGTITSVAMQPMEWFEQFGFTIYDEIDQYCTAKRATVFRGMSRYALGMSATCFERLDGLDTIAHNHVGAPISAERILTIQDTCDKPNGAGKQWKFKAWAVRYNGPDCYTRSVLSQQGTVSHPMMVSQFSCDPYRNQLIVDETVRLYRAGHSVFVFLDRVTLIKQLAEETRRVLGLCTEERTDVSELIGEKNEDERRDAEGAKICFLSYKCGGVGLSWPRFSAAVFAHPRRNRYKQFLNRIFRENGDETITREAVYIVDNSTSLKGQYSGFRKTCREERDVTPETRTVDYHEILPSEQIKTLSLQLKEN